MVAPTGIAGTKIYSVGASIARPFFYGFLRTVDIGHVQKMYRYSLNSPLKSLEI